MESSARPSVLLHDHCQRMGSSVSHLSAARPLLTETAVCEVGLIRGGCPRAFLVSLRNVIRAMRSSSRCSLRRGEPKRRTILALNSLQHHNPSHPFLFRSILPSLLAPSQGIGPLSLPAQFPRQTDLPPRGKRSRLQPFEQVASALCPFPSHRDSSPVGSRTSAASLF